MTTLAQVRQPKKSLNIAVQDLKCKFTQLLYKEKILESYIDDLTIHKDKREAKKPEFKNVLKELNEIINELASSGYQMTSQEIHSGF